MIPASSPEQGPLCSLLVIRATDFYINLCCWTYSHEPRYGSQGKLRLGSYYGPRCQGWSLKTGYYFLPSSLLFHFYNSQAAPFSFSPHLSITYLHIVDAPTVDLAMWLTRLWVTSSVHSVWCFSKLICVWLLVLYKKDKFEGGMAVHSSQSLLPCCPVFSQI